jgi:hypothetical protein
VECLGNDSKESGYVKDAPALLEAKGFVGTEYITLQVRQRQETRDLQEPPGSVVEELALPILHERLGVQHIGESTRRQSTGRRGDDSAPRVERREWAKRTTQRRGDVSCKGTPKAEHADISWELRETK